MSDKPTEVVYLLFLGTEIDRKGQKSHMWLHLPDGESENNGDPIEYDVRDPAMKLYTNTRPWLPSLSGGEIISIERSTAEDDADKFTLFGGTARLVAQWSNRGQLAQWQAQHCAHRLADDARRTKKANVDLSLLDPLKVAYQSLPRRTRHAMLVRIIAYLEGDPIKK